MSALVNQVNYTPKMPSVKSRHMTVNVTPTNGSSWSSGQDQVILDIGTGGYGQYLCQNETYLKFRVTNTNTNAHDLILDRDCSCLWSRSTISHSSQILEDLTDLNTMNRVFQDCQIGPGKQLTTGSCTRGHAENADVADNNTVYSGASIAQNTSQTFCMSLFSGILGPQCPKFIPLSACGAGGPIRLTLTLDNFNNSCRSGGASACSFTIDEVNLVCGIVEVDQAGQQMIDASSAGLYAISSTGYRNYTANAGGAGENNVELLVPAKASSMKALYTVQRPQAQINDSTKNSIGCRDRADLTEFHWTCGGVRYPAGKPISSTGGDSYSQLMKTFNGINNLHQECDFGRTRYELTTSTATDAVVATKGAFVAGIELESYGNDGIESGLNTLGQNLFFNGTYDSIPGAYKFNFISVFDTLITVEGGIMQVKF